MVPSTYWEKVTPLSFSVIFPDTISELNIPPSFGSTLAGSKQTARLLPRRRCTTFHAGSRHHKMTPKYTSLIVCIMSKISVFLTNYLTQQLYMCKL